jgi:hypothetical protein
MNFTNRDKLLMLLLPAMAISFGYFGWVGYRKQNELLSRRNDVAKAQRDVPPAELLRQRQMEVAKLSREIDKYHQDEAASRQAWDELAAKCASAEQRNERIEKLSSLLKSQRLVLMEDAEPDTSKAVHLSKTVDELGKLLASKTLKPQLRQLHFYGGYPEVHNVLQELARGPVLAIPVSLTMKQSLRLKDRREWTLLVWI